MIYGHFFCNLLCFGYDVSDKYKEDLLSRQRRFYHPTLSNIVRGTPFTDSYSLIYTEIAPLRQEELFKFGIFLNQATVRKYRPRIATRCCTAYIGTHDQDRHPHGCFAAGRASSSFSRIALATSDFMNIFHGSPVQWFSIMGAIGP